VFLTSYLDVHSYFSGFGEKLCFVLDFSWEVQRLALFQVVMTSHNVFVYYLSRTLVNVDTNHSGLDGVL